MRRITTGLVLMLSATCSDLRGSSPDQAIKLKTCTATANLLFVDISNYLGNYGPPFCNHYSYKFDFVNPNLHSNLRKTCLKMGSSGPRSTELITRVGQQVQVRNETKIALILRNKRFVVNQRGSGNQTVCY